MARIELKNVSKTYPNNIQAVKNLSLVIENGNFVVLVGPSGCGKTTILRMLAGLEDITEGELFFNDMKMNNVEPADRNIGMVFQEYALYPNMSVYENIAFPLQVQRRKQNSITKTEIKKNVWNALEQLELTSLANRKPKELSGGQRQRVALGRALVRQPQLFLFDEPLSNLDSKLRIVLRQEIINLHKQLGITSVYVTHDQVEAMTMGNKIAILKEGNLQQYTTPFDIYNNPQNLFVADFIGSPSVNIFEGKVENNVFYESNSNITIPLNNIAIKELNFVNFITIRPEKIVYGSSQATNRINIPFFVDNLEFIGNETIIYFKTGNTQKRFFCSPTQIIKCETAQECNFALESILFFDSNGNRLNQIY